MLGIFSLLLQYIYDVSRNDRWILMENATRRVCRRYFSVLKRPVHVVSAERKTRKAPSLARRSLGIKDQGSWMRCTRISLSYILANQLAALPFHHPPHLLLSLLLYLHLVSASFSSPRISRDFCRIACPARLPNIRHHHSLRVPTQYPSLLSILRQSDVATLPWITAPRQFLLKQSRSASLLFLPIKPRKFSLGSLCFLYVAYIISVLWK